MNPRYGTQNAPTSNLKLLHVSTHIIGFHFRKHSAMHIISVCMSLIYCLTHVECFRLFLAANIVAAPINFRQRAQYMYYKQRLWRLCPPYCEKEVGFLGHVTHVTGEITRFEATCFRHACDTLTQVCDQVFHQICSWLE